MEVRLDLHPRLLDGGRRPLSVIAALGQQFDDDLNTLLLKKFFTVDLYLGRGLGHGVEIFAAAENLFNQRYYTALTTVPNLPPVPSLGAPLLARIGLRYQFPKR